MKLPLSYGLAAAAGLWLSSQGYAQPPARIAAQPQPQTAGATSDRMIAEAVSERLAQVPGFVGYQIEVSVLNGSVELSGAVASAAMRDELLRQARGVRHVTSIEDRLTVKGQIQQVSGQGQPLPAPVPLNGGMINGQVIGAPGLLPHGSTAIDPTPLGGHGPAGAMLHPPALPNHAWPTYAPYNNYSRVAYPQEYPYSAFPFIGPMYPFPKVPLGYRAIKLEWEDGHWWYGRTATRRDWWTVRYW